MKLAIISRLDSQNTADLLAAADKLGVASSVYELGELALDTANLASHKFFSHDAYLFRGYNKNIALAQSLAQTLAERGKVVIDGKLVNGFISNKFHQALLYEQHGIRHVPTYQAGSIDAWRKMGTSITFPVVVKDIDSQKGKGVRLCHSEEELLQEIEQKGTRVLIQKFVKMSFDIRVICVGDAIIGAIKRRSAGTDFRTNISLGGQAEPYTLNKDERALAMLAHRTVGYDISGVDLAYDDSGKPWVIETNIAPEWQGFKQATGLDVADAIVRYVMEIKV